MLVDVTTNPLGRGTHLSKNLAEILNSVAILAVLVALPLTMSAAPVKVDFEGLPTTGPGEGGQIAVFHQYASQGVSFNDPLALDYSKGATPWRYPGFAHSGTKAIEQCYGKEFCNTPILMTFTTPQKRVEVWVGYSTNLTKQKTVLLTAFDSTGAKISQVTGTFQPGTSPIPIQTSLEITSTTQNISSASVSFGPDTYGTVSNGNLAVDDVEFDTAGPLPPCPSTANPVVTLSQLSAGQIVRSNMFSLQGTVTTTAPLEKATLTITGPGGTNSLDLLANGTIPHNGGAFSAYGLTDMLFVGSNKVTISVQDCQNSGESSITVVFQPCDQNTNPKVTILTPSPSVPNNVVSGETFELKGNVQA